jgi:kumamolisin
VVSVGCIKCGHSRHRWIDRRAIRQARTWRARCRRRRRAEERYRVFVNGETLVASGTSAVAPLWGAFIALLNAGRGEALGFVNDRFYQAPNLLKPITSGDNRDAVSGLGYDAGPGWNACTGLGAPNGAAIIAALTAVA